MEKIMGIYLINNLVNNKKYIGSTINMYMRFHNHLSQLRTKTHKNCHLQRAFDRDGENNFQFKIIENIHDVGSLAVREQYWMDYYQSGDRKFGYNLIIDAVHFTVSEETREKMSKSKKGKKKSEEHKIKLHNNLKQYSDNRKWTPSQREKLMISRRNPPPKSEETRRKSSVLQKGIKRGPLPLEVRKKMSASAKGRKKTAEHKMKIGLARKGKKFTEEQRKHASRGQQNRSPEWRAKLSEANSKVNAIQVLEIRTRAKNGERAKELSNDYGICRSCIQDIINRKTWKHLP